MVSPIFDGQHKWQRIMTHQPQEYYSNCGLVSKLLGTGLQREEMNRKFSETSQQLDIAVTSNQATDHLLLFQATIGQ